MRSSQLAKSRLFTCSAIGTTQRAPVTHAAGDLGAVALDLHAASATMSELTASHVPVEVLLVELQAGGYPLENASQTRAV